MARDRELIPMGTDLWIVNNPHRWVGLDARGRMTVMRLSQGGLVLHSPVPIDDALAAALAELGPVEHLVAPNKYHHVYVAEVQARYPEAKLWGAPGLEKKRKDLNFDGLLGDEPHPHWAGQIDQGLYGGAKAFNEVVFFHRASGALIVTDLLMNIHESVGWMSTVVWKLEGVWRRPGFPRLVKLITRDKQAARESVTRYLGWPFTQVIMAHGEPLDGPDAYDITAGLFQWLVKAPPPIAREPAS